MNIASAYCMDKKGPHLLYARLIHEFGKPHGDFKLPMLLADKAAEIFEKSSKYEVLFSNFSETPEQDFIFMFMDPRGVWVEIVDQELNHLGVLYLTDISPGYDAYAHITFWDAIASGRESIVWEALKWAFDRYKLVRISAEIPQSLHGLRKFTKKLGFVEEGVRRKSFRYKGHWIDSDMFGMLDSELKEITNGRKN